MNFLELSNHICWIIGLLGLLLYVIIAKKYQFLIGELDSCYAYLGAKSFSSHWKKEPRQFFVRMLNNINQFIDSELTKITIGKLPTPASESLESLELSFARLAILTIKEAGGLRLVDIAGQIKLIPQEKVAIEEELSMLLFGSEPNQLYLLDYHLYSSFSKYGVKFLLKIEDCQQEGGDVATLWFGFSENQPMSLHANFQAKCFARSFFANYATSQQLKGLAGKIVKSRQENIYKSRLISGLSHDLCSPIHNLQAITTCLRDNFSMTDEGLDLISMANANIRVINELIGDLLSLAKFRSGNLQTNPERIKVADLFRELVKIYQFDAQLKSLDLKLDSIGVDDYLFVDRLQIKRIMGNLISNAIKYTPKGAVILVGKACPLGYQLSVIDSGVGLTASQIKTICRPFVRFSDQEIEGVGLGLAVTKLLIELHSGKLEIYSKAGMGSEFRVILPEGNLQSDSGQALLEHNQ